MSHVIPREPDTLYIKIDHLWNGNPCGDESMHAEAWVMEKQNGLEVRVHAPLRDDRHVPDAPRDTRVDGSWEFDAIELFFVGEDGTYTEVELGPGGHYLVLSFDGVRHRSNDWLGREFVHRNASATPGTWQSVIQLPWDVLPKKIVRANAFVLVGGQHLAWSAVPGAEPDFHQPDVFSSVTFSR
ncbi:hypothetical protein A2348_01845 [Candidatus Uhrbacteria bacterium RIFOXYB12_FULL_58_10]|nr:MAG: hypothetical protein A2348_01845 [Candidatus Uhrbacteria bacterium RIFOXYB12_FULL_58_10]